MAGAAASFASRGLHGGLWGEPTGPTCSRLGARCSPWDSDTGRLLGDAAVLGLSLLQDPMEDLGFPSLQTTLAPNPREL